MKVKIVEKNGVKSIVVKNIQNEGQLEFLYSAVEESGCAYELKKNCTEMNISGNVDMFLRHVNSN